MKNNNFGRVAKSSTTICVVATAWLLLAGLASPTSAHHSYAMFDGSKTLTVSAGAPTLHGRLRMASEYGRKLAAAPLLCCLLLGVCGLTAVPNKATASEITFCVGHDRSIDPENGKQRFDMTAPPDLAPPPLH